MKNIEITFKNEEIRVNKVIYDFSKSIFLEIPENYKFKIEKVTWNYLDKKVEINSSKNDMRIKYACPSRDNTKMLIIFNDETDNVKSSLIIFDGEGKVSENIKFPNLISSVSKSLTIHRNVEFKYVYWNNIKEREVFVDIGFNEDFYEIRLFDVETLEFKECIGSGRM